MITGIQLILLTILGLLILRTIKRFRDGAVTQLSFSGWMLLWVLGVIFVINPESTNRVADIVGVGRGADVILYISIVLLFYMLFKLYNRTISIEQDITKLVRAISLKDDGDEHDKKT